MNVIFLANGVPWFGAHSGEGAMLPHLENLTRLHLVAPVPGVRSRFLGKIHSTLRGWPARDQTTSWAECRALFLNGCLSNSVLHLLRTEEHETMLRSTRRRHGVIGTVHLPGCKWSANYREAIKRLSRVIVYFTAAVPELADFIPRENISFIHDGVATDFFTPGDLLPPAPRLLFAGVYLRNTRMLARVIKRLAVAHPELGFDLLVPLRRREQEGLNELYEHPAVQWHAGLSDPELRDLYRRSYALLLPMDESGANTAVVEALACGTPVITTDVGGIRDYGGGSLYPIVANDDDDAMVALVEKYLANPAWRQEVAMASRTFAESTLAWPLIAARHVEAYRELFR